VRLIDQIRGDFQNRRNLDVYVTIVAASVIAGLSFFDVLPPDKIGPTVLAVLAVMAFNLLATRVGVESARAERPERFNSNFPADMITKREDCDDVYLIGVSLSRTIEGSYGAFERNLKRGARLRILLTNPAADATALDARGQITRPALVDIKHEIEQSLRQMAQLKKSTGGNLEVRLTRVALKFGMQFLTPDSRTAEMHVQLYSFRLVGESRPMFTLTHADGEWFDCFAAQATALWEDAEVVDLEAVVL